VARTPPGSSVQLTIMRNGSEQQVRATLGEATAKNTGDDEGDGVGNGGSNGNSQSTGKLGLSVQPLTPDIAQQLGLRGVTQGLVVGDVDPNGPAADAGIQQGDVILQINQQPVRTVADTQTALNRSGSRPALLLVNRRGTTVFITVTPRR
jgi:serine protease Do